VGEAQRGPFQHGNRYGSDISDIAILSGITNMVKALISAINNIPQRTYLVAQYTDSRNRLDPLVERAEGREAGVTARRVGRQLLVLLCVYA